MISIGLSTQAYAGTAPPAQPGISNGAPVKIESHTTAADRTQCSHGGAGPPVGGSNVSECQQSVSKSQQANVESANTPLFTAPSVVGPVQSHPPAGTPAAR